MYYEEYLKLIQCYFDWKIKKKYILLSIFLSVFIPYYIKKYMKKIILATLPLALLASCNNPTLTNTGTTTTGAVTATGVTPTATVSGSAIEAGSQVSLLYTLRENDANGKILDTNILADKKIQDPTFSGSTLSPLDAIIGSQGLIPGFEKALIGMRTGESKNFTVSPQEGYGTGMTTEEVAKSKIAPVFEQTTTRDVIEGVVKQTYNKTDFPAEMLTELNSKKVGDSLTGKNGQSGKIVEVTDKTATIEFQNTASPFYQKTVSVGMTQEKDGVTYKITKIEGNNVTFEVTNPQSPFAGKEFAVGSTAENEIAGTDGTKKKITIKVVKIDGDMVTVETTNTHPLANKTLYFHVEVKDVKPGVLPNLPSMNMEQAKTTTATGA